MTRIAAAGIMAMLWCSSAWAGIPEDVSMKVEKVSQQGNLRVVLFTVANGGTSSVSTAVVTCDGFTAASAPLTTATAGVYEIAPGKSGIGQAAFTDLAVEKVDCRLTSVFR